MLFAFIYIFFYLISICLLFAHGSTLFSFSYWGVSLMNDLNAFNVYLSDCHTECTANDCSKELRHRNEIKSKRYLCRLSLSPSNELSWVFFSCVCVANGILAMSSPLESWRVGRWSLLSKYVKSQWIIPIAPFVCRNVKMFSDTHTMNK